MNRDNLRTSVPERAMMGRAIEEVTVYGCEWQHGLRPRKSGHGRRYAKSRLDERWNFDNGTAKETSIGYRRRENPDLMVLDQ